MQRFEVFFVYQLEQIKMKWIFYLFCIVFTFINAPARQVHFSSNMQINPSRKGDTLFSAISRPTYAKGSISFSFFYSYNRQGNYNSRYGDVSYVNHLKLFGVNWGGDVNYKRMLADNLFIAIGIGYLDFEVNKIENETKNGSIIIKTDARPIDYYPSAIYVLYQTTKYHYNNLCFHLGIEKQFILLHTLSLFMGIDYLHAYRLSEVYFIPFARKYYRTENHGDFGDFVYAHFGVSKQWEKFSVAPAFVLSIYNGWKQDILFGEEPVKVVSNWLNGVGVSVDISYQIFR